MKILTLRTRNIKILMKDELKENGFFLLKSELTQEEILQLKSRMQLVQERIVEEIGIDRLQKAGELGVLRNMVRYDTIFTDLLELDSIKLVSEFLLSPTSILHLQNGFILPPVEEPKEVFQTKFHQDFPRVFGGALLSLNYMLALDEFTELNGGTLVVPRSHQTSKKPDLERVKTVPVCCPAGTAIVFDSTLWHAAGQNRSSAPRMAINHQFTHSFIKQQIDYCRSLGTNRVEKFPERTKQMLGFFTRVVTSLDEYYRPEKERLYRSGQG